MFVNACWQCKLSTCIYKPQQLTRFHSDVELVLELFKSQNYCAYCLHLRKVLLRQRLRMQFVIHTIYKIRYFNILFNILRIFRQYRLNIGVDWCWRQRAGRVNWRNWGECARNFATCCWNYLVDWIRRARIFVSHRSVPRGGFGKLRVTFNAAALELQRWTANRIKITHEIVRAPLSAGNSSPAEPSAD